MGDVLMNLFYTVVVLASAFVVHKLVWLVQYRKLQGVLVQEALRKVSDVEAEAMLQWDGFTERTWLEGTSDFKAKSLGDYLEVVTRSLDGAIQTLHRSRQPMKGRLRALLDADQDGAIDKERVLEIPAIGRSEPIQVEFSCKLPRPAEAPALDPSLYKLEVKSRYGRIRRGLVFFLGLADIIYSTQHMTVMTENPHTPVSLLFRRISLVLMLLFFLLIDVIFGIRKSVSAWIGVLMGRRPGVKTGADFVSYVYDSLPDIFGFVAWTGLISGIYFFTFLAIRSKSLAYATQLRRMHDEEEGKRRALRKRHVGELGVWIDGFGKSLDRMIEISAQNAMLLVANARERLHRRAVGEALRRMVAKVGAGLLSRLPESKGELADELTTQKHTLAHYWWPRPEEMQVGVRQACIRAALHDIEFTMGALGSPSPDLALVDQLWRRLLAYSRAFPDAMPAGLEKELKASYQQQVERLVRETREDLEPLDKRLRAIAEQLVDYLKLTAPLLEFQVTRTDERIEASLAELEAQVRQMRERARLEAMAFEI